MSPDGGRARERRALGPRASPDRTARSRTGKPVTAEAREAEGIGPERRSSPPARRCGGAAARRPDGRAHGRDGRTRMGSTACEFGRDGLSPIGRTHEPGETKLPWARRCGARRIGAMAHGSRPRRPTAGRRIEAEARKAEGMSPATHGGRGRSDAPLGEPARIEPLDSPPLHWHSAGRPQGCAGKSASE
jgi:hypothetical protein